MGARGKQAQLAQANGSKFNLLLMLVAQMSTYPRAIATHYCSWGSRNFKLTHGALTAFEDLGVQSTAVTEPLAPRKADIGPQEGTYASSIGGGTAAMGVQAPGRRARLLAVWAGRGSNPGGYHPSSIAAHGATRQKTKSLWQYSIQSRQLSSVVYDSQHSRQR